MHGQQKSLILQRSTLREMNGNGIFGKAGSYQGIVASVAGAIVCSVGSGLFYLTRSLATRQEINEAKQEMKKEIKEVKEELKGDIKENGDTLKQIYGLLTDKK